MHPDTYHLYSTLKGQPNLGIWYLYQQEQQQQEPIGQPVRLDADLVNWAAPRSVAGGGPFRLGVGPYLYTCEYKGEVFATNQSDLSQEWFLVPADLPNTFLIATGPKLDRVWTAEAPREPIKIKRFTGEPNQVFRLDQQPA